MSCRVQLASRRPYLLAALPFLVYWQFLRPGTWNYFDASFPSTTREANTALTTALGTWDGREFLGFPSALNVHLQVSIFALVRLLYAMGLSGSTAQWLYYSGFSALAFVGWVLLGRASGGFSDAAAAAGGAVFIFNPWVLDRLQFWTMFAGYALIPLALYLIYRLLRVSLLSAEAPLNLLALTCAVAVMLASPYPPVFFAFAAVGMVTYSLAAHNVPLWGTAVRIGVGLGSILVLLGFLTFPAIAWLRSHQVIGLAAFHGPSSLVERHVSVLTATGLTDFHDPVLAPMPRVVGGLIVAAVALGTGLVVTHRSARIALGGALVSVVLAAAPHLLPRSLSSLVSHLPWQRTDSTNSSALTAMAYAFLVSLGWDRLAGGRPSPRNWVMIIVLWGVLVATSLPVVIPGGARFGRFEYPSDYEHVEKLLTAGPSGRVVLLPPDFTVAHDWAPYAVSGLDDYEFDNVLWGPSVAEVMPASTLRVMPTLLDGLTWQRNPIVYRMTDTRFVVVRLDARGRFSSSSGEHYHASASPHQYYRLLLHLSYMRLVFHDSRLAVFEYKGSLPGMSYVSKRPLVVTGNVNLESVAPARVADSVLSFPTDQGFSQSVHIPSSATVVAAPQPLTAAPPFAIPPIAGSVWLPARGSYRPTVMAGSDSDQVTYTGHGIVVSPTQVVVGSKDISTGVTRRYSLGQGTVGVLLAHTVIGAPTLLPGQSQPLAFIPPGTYAMRPIHTVTTVGLGAQSRDGWSRSECADPGQRASLSNGARPTGHLLELSGNQELLCSRLPLQPAEAPPVPSLYAVTASVRTISGPGAHVVVSQYANKRLLGSTALSVPPSSSWGTYSLLFTTKPGATRAVLALVTTSESRTRPMVLFSRVHLTRFGLGNVLQLQAPEPGPATTVVTGNRNTLGVSAGPGVRHLRLPPVLSGSSWSGAGDCSTALPGTPRLQATIHTGGVTELVSAGHIGCLQVGLPQFRPGYLYELTLQYRVVRGPAPTLAIANAASVKLLSVSSLADTSRWRALHIAMVSHGAGTASLFLYGYGIGTNSAVEFRRPSLSVAPYIALQLVHVAPRVRHGYHLVVLDTAYDSAWSVSRSAHVLANFFANGFIVPAGVATASRPSNTGAIWGQLGAVCSLLCGGAVLFTALIATLYWALRGAGAGQAAAQRKRGPAVNEHSKTRR